MTRKQAVSQPHQPNQTSTFLSSTRTRLSLHTIQLHPSSWPRCQPTSSKLGKRGSRTSGDGRRKRARSHDRSGRGAPRKSKGRTLQEHCPFFFLLPVIRAEVEKRRRGIRGRQGERQEVRLNGRFEGEFEAASARAGADWLVHRPRWSAVLIGWRVYGRRQGSRCADCLFGSWAVGLRA